ncbi:TatD family hydrolase [Christensenellaceae bacterium OttesenSCG-928-K19]|nr:TatD family hydrolase [Christensenellaceae bacterium OttesenSCG-928-K19]
MKGLNMYYDTHAHLLDEQFDEDRHSLILSLPGQGIGWYNECGSDMDTSIRAVALAKEHAMVYAAVGVHPHSAKEWDAHSAGELKSLAKNSKVVAIGEIGLDYHYDFSQRNTQKDVFAHQMELAWGLGLPVIIHSREATEDTLAVLRRFPHVTGVLHSFSGSVETMREALSMGYYISLSGVVTFKNAKKTVEVAAEVPIERLLIETDSPYMAPAPHRGKRNDPSLVKCVAQKIAEIRGMDTAEIERITTANAKRFFGVE